MRPNLKLSAIFTSLNVKLFTRSTSYETESKNFYDTNFGEIELKLFYVTNFFFRFLYVQNREIDAKLYHVPSIAITITILA